MGDIVVTIRIGALWRIGRPPIPFVQVAPVASGDAQSSWPQSLRTLNRTGSARITMAA